MQDMVLREESLELPPASHLPGVFTSESHNNVIGELPKEEMLGCVGKSQIKASVIAPYMDEDHKGSTSTPAALNASDCRLQHPDHPLKHSIGKFFRGSVRALDPKAKQQAMNAYKMWTLEVLDTEDFSPLSYEEIIQGTRMEGSNPMNLNSSPGKPYVHTKVKKGKRDYFEISEEGHLDYFDPKIKAEFEQFYEKLSRRILPLTICYDFPKDELRPEGKALGTATTPPKTRTVTCMNMLHLMAWRKACLRFWDAKHRAADGTYPFCPGINAEGPEWSKAFHYLNRHPNCVDFDVANWDGFMTPEFMFMLVDCICEVARLTPEQRNVLLSIITEVSNAFIQYGRMVYQKIRGMVSGFPGTAEVNTDVHFILILYFYFMLVPSQYATYACFRRHVSFLVYGDDVIITFSDEIKPFFNGKTLLNQWNKLGYTVTDSSKRSEIPECKRLSESSFLKSSWNVLRDQIYVRKMDTSVVTNLLYWVRAKADPVDQFCSNAVDAMRVMFGHGREAYNDFTRDLARWTRKAGVVLPIYTYDEIFDDHMRRYYNVDGLDIKF
jgi:hypothetical protein